jgi:hypothetical protein
LLIVTSLRLIWIRTMSGYSDNTASKAAAGTADSDRTSQS